MDPRQPSPVFRAAVGGCNRHWDPNFANEGTEAQRREGPLPVIQPKSNPSGPRTSSRQVGTIPAESHTSPLPAMGNPGPPRARGVPFPSSGPALVRQAPLSEASHQPHRVWAPPLKMSKLRPGERTCPDPSTSTRQGQGQGRSAIPSRLWAGVCPTPATAEPHVSAVSLTPCTPRYLCRSTLLQLTGLGVPAPHALLCVSCP